MARVAFPLDPNLALDASRMSDAQKQGFDLALQSQIRWARQIEQASVIAADDGETITRQYLIQHQARLARGMAEAMRLAVLGRS